MILHLIHTEASQQPVAATVAREISRTLPVGYVKMISTEAASAENIDENDLVLAVFSVKNGAYAPIVPFYQQLRNKKVAFLAVLTGPVEAARVRKTVWAVKKQFCGNRLVGGYLCPAPDDMAWGLTREEMEKARNFAQTLYDEHIAPGEDALAANF